MEVVSKFIPPYPLNTPVLFLIFNRLDTTKQVFEMIRKAKPPRLYIAADGPRENVPGEEERVKAVREYVLNNIDWDCEVKTLFRDKNLGCGKAVSQAISWFFENEEMGIILEDDTLPSLSFFWFCEKMLDMYREETSIMMITGTSYLFNEINYMDSYFLSKYFPIWGWATWRDRWSEYDFNLTNWPEMKKKKLVYKFIDWDRYIARTFEYYFEMAYRKEIDTWDFQWVYLCFLKNGFCLTPFKNLVSNIGIQGTRSSKSSPFINMPRVEIDLHSIVHPKQLRYIPDIDKKLFHNIFYRFEKFVLFKKIKLFMKSKIFL